MLHYFALALFVIGTEAAFEGDRCANDGDPGRCTILKNCATALADIDNGINPPICTFENFEPIVCCTSSRTTTTRRPGFTTRKRLPSRTTTEYTPEEEVFEDAVPSAQKRSNFDCKPLPPTLTAPRNGQKAWDKCVEYQQTLVYPCQKSVAIGSADELSRVNRCHHNADELIVGGTNAGKDEFPHMVLLGYGKDLGSLKWECAGSIISERFILTAGHCIANTAEEAVSYVQVGALRRSDNSPRDRYRVYNIHKHAAYDPPHRYDDIALLELDTDVPLNEHTVPACVHTGEVVDDGRASATGWGDTTFMGVKSNILQKVVLAKFNSSECRQQYKPGRLLRRGFDETSQLCFGDHTFSNDTCQGDSGGPIQIKSRKLACMYTIIGVTSFGRECGKPGVPGIYTRVANYLPWIESIVWPDL